MSAAAIAFLILGGLTLVSSLLVVATRSPVGSALWLALAFGGVAGLFVLLGAQFLAAIQIIVYAGAILVFFLFVIMLLNLSKLPGSDPHRLQRWLGLYLAIAIGLGAAFAAATAGGVGAAGASQPTFGSTADLAALLYRDYVFPFEIASLLLTGAVVGAVVLARRWER